MNACLVCVPVLGCGCTYNDVHVPSGAVHAHLECVPMMCVWGCGCSRSLVCARGSLGTHQTALYACICLCIRLCTSRRGCVCLCRDLCPCVLCMHHRLVHAPVMFYVPLRGCAHQYKVVQDCTCPFHLLCGTRGDLCPCAGLCLCLCGAVQHP